MYISFVSTVAMTDATASLFLRVEEPDSASVRELMEFHSTHYLAVSTFTYAYIYIYIYFFVFFSSRFAGCTNNYEQRPETTPSD